MEQSENRDNYFSDPFGALYMKILATVAYILGLPGCGVAFCFIWYESSGRAGPYRTCINQLVSRKYFLVSSTFIFQRTQFLMICVPFLDYRPLCIHWNDWCDKGMVWTFARLYLHTNASHQAHILHDGFSVMDSSCTFKSLDCLCTKISSNHGWQFCGGVCYQSILHDVISL